MPPKKKAKAKLTKRGNGQRGAGKVKGTSKKPKSTAIPKDWEKAVLVAYWRTMDATQPQAAEVVGVSLRTVSVWENSVWWPEALAEGRRRFFGKLSGIACRNVLEGLSDRDEKFGMAKWVSDRLTPELSPPRQRIDHDIDAKVEAKANVVVYIPDNGRDKKDG